MSKNLLQKTAEKVIVVDETKKDEIEGTTSQEESKPNLTRNVLIGLGALGAIYLLFFSKTSKAQTSDYQNVRADMRLSKNYVLGEFLVSSDMPELREYKLSKNEMTNLMRVVNVLQTFNDRYGISIFITSGGRPATLKAKSGKYKGLDFVQILTEKQYSPSTFSQHMDFSAADFTTADKKKLLDIYHFVKDNYNKDIPQVSQIILYIDNGVPNFIHMGVPSVENDFSKVIGDNVFLLAKVETFMSDGQKKRKTKFFNYSQEKLMELLSELPPMA